MFEKFTNLVSTLSPYMFSKENFNRVRLACATLLDVATATIETAVPFLIIDYSDIPVVLYLAAGSYLMAQMIPKLKNMLLNPVRENVQKQLTHAMMEKAYQLDLHYHLTVKTGEITQALGRNYTTVDKIIPSFFGELSPAIFRIIGPTIGLTYFFGPLGLTESGIFVIYSVIAIFREANTEEIRKACVNFSHKTYGLFLEAFANYRLAHQFGNTLYEVTRTHEVLKGYERLFGQVHRREDKTALLLSAVNILGTVGGLTLAASMLPGGTNNKNFVLFAYFLLKLNIILDSLPSTISTLSTALVDAEKIVDFLNKNTPHISGSIKLSNLTSPSIKFRNITFYHNTKKILDNVSFEVQAGQRVAIVGPSGSGKSTLLSLLLRFYTPNEGNILINDIDVATVDRESLRAQITVASQDTSLFNEKVSENIKYGDLHAPDEEVTEAAKLAELVTDADAIAKLAEPAGQLGGKLSGGEKQRVSIARALLKGASIYLLDEPTSALDLKTEREVQKTLDALTSSGVTTLLVTHHLTTTVNADLIIYLDNGKILEQGTFEQLMHMQGSFYQQLAIQCEQLGVAIESIHPEAQTPNSNQAVSFFRSAQQQRRRREQDSQILEIATQEDAPLLQMA